MQTAGGEKINDLPTHFRVKAKHNYALSFINILRMKNAPKVAKCVSLSKANYSHVSHFLAPSSLFDPLLFLPSIENHYEIKSNAFDIDPVSNISPEISFNHDAFLCQTFSY